jgi:hypothetical protein
MHATPQMQPNLLPPTIRTHASNNGNDQMPHHSHYYCRRPTYLPTRSVSYFHPYTHPQNHFYQNVIPYNGFRYPSTNPFRPTFGYPMYRLQSAVQQVKTYAEPRMYDFFAAEKHHMRATNSQVNIHSSSSSNGGNEKIKENISIVPSNAITPKHVSENVSNHSEDDKNGVNDEHDLTLCL